MKPLLFGLVLGLAIGYWQGFGDGKAGRANIAVRTLNKFGAAKMQAARDDRTRRTEEAARP